MWIQIETMCKLSTARMRLLCVKQSLYRGRKHEMPLHCVSTLCPKVPMSILLKPVTKI
jgi:hypothetical protein